MMQGASGTVMQESNLELGLAGLRLLVEMPLQVKNPSEAAEVRTQMVEAGVGMLVRMELGRMVESNHSSSLACLRQCHPEFNGGYTWQESYYILHGSFAFDQAVGDLPLYYKERIS
jgi:hypothetical protein